MHPEQLSIPEQLNALAGARVIAGEAGSAFHLLMYFGREFSRKSVIQLGVCGIRRDPRIINFVEQFRQQPVDFRYLCCLGFCTHADAPGTPNLGSQSPHRRVIVPTRLLAWRLERLSEHLLA